MSFFKKLKHALGFGDDSSDNLLDDTEVETETGGAESSGAPSADTPVLADPADDREFSPEMRSRIFDHVVAVFNGAMPDFIRNSVDTHAQSEYIYNTLDDSIKAYFDSFEASLRKYYERLSQERDCGLSAEIGRLREESKKIEDDRNAIRERQLSADRQKRALGDRVHELEQQIGVLDAEREQLQLENKSMLNKLKVAQVQGCDTELAAKLAELEKQNEELTVRNNSLTTENGKLHEAVEKQADMHGISEAMMGDLRQSAAKAREELNQQKRACEAVTEELKNEKLSHEATAVTLSRLKQELDNAQKELEQTRKRLTEAESIVAEAPLLMAELEKREKRIARLKSEKIELQRRLEVAQAVAMDAPSAAYGTDTSAPEAALEVAPTSEAESDKPAAKPRQPKPGPRMPRITDEALDEVDEQFGNEIWTTDSHESAKPTIEKENPRQSRRKHTPADDAQLSLF